MGTSLYGCTLALPANIRLGRKGFLGIKILAYYKNPKLKVVKVL
jgi:hypothetical protein